MCLAIPGKIVEIKGDTAVVDYSAERRKAKLADKSCKVGDYVLVSTGIIIQKLDKKEAEEALRLIASL